MSAHDSRIHFKLDEIEVDLRALARDATSVDSAVTDLRRHAADAKLKLQDLMERRQEIAADIAILREMLGVR
jgi:hypothetical protein